jgi:hypothetical protein
MSLAFDPSELDSEDIGENQATLELGHEDRIDQARDVCE